MRKKILLFILTFVLLFSFGEVADAAKKQYVCKYEGGGKVAEFRLRLGKNGKTYAEDADISGNSESVINWSSNPYEDQGIDFTGADYYEEKGDCPPFAYFFVGSRDHIFGISFDMALAKFVVAPENPEEFEKNLKKYYTNTYRDVVLMTKTGQMQELPPEKLPTSCLDFGKQGDSNATLIEDRQSCENNDYFACVWVETNANPAGGYCNTDELQYVKCGDAFDIPHQVPRIFSLVVNLLKIATPIILVVVSIISLLKALASSKEDEIKKAQSGMIKKVIASAMVFFVISIVQFVVLKVADTSEKTGLSNCLSCMLNNDCQNSLYYKTNVGGQYFCTDLSGDDIECTENK